MLSVLFNNWDRIKEDKIHIIISVGLTVFAMIMAILLTNKMENKINIAVVGDVHDLNNISELRITQVDTKPAQSQLLQNQYAAVITYAEDGSYTIDSLKGDEVIEKLNNLLSENAMDKNEIEENSEIANNQRQIGTNIVGYMMMFVLMQGMLYARLFAEDKEKHMIERVAIAPVSFLSYFMANVIFSWLLIFIPTYSVILIANLIGVTLGFTLFQYAMVMAVLSFTAICFAMFVHSFYSIADSGNMIGTVIIILTSLVSGSFYSLDSEHSIINKILFCMPQKDFMYFLEDLESNIINIKDIFGIVYVIIISGIMLMIGINKTRKDYCFRSI